MADAPSLVTHRKNLIVSGLLGPRLGQERFVNVRDDTTTSDGGLDECVELLITADGQLQMTRRDTLDLEVFGRVAGKFEDLRGEVFQDRGAVHGCSSADAALGRHGVLEKAVDATDRELRTQNIKYSVAAWRIVATGEAHKSGGAGPARLLGWSGWQKSDPKDKILTPSGRSTWSPARAEFLEGVRGTGCGTGVGGSRVESVKTPEENV